MREIHTDAVHKTNPILDVPFFIGVHRCSSVAKISFSGIGPSLGIKKTRICHRWTPMDTDGVCLKRPVSEDASDFMASRSHETSPSRISQILDVQKKQMNRKERKERKGKNKTLGPSDGVIP